LIWDYETVREGDFGTCDFMMRRKGEKEMRRWKNLVVAQSNQYPASSIQYLVSSIQYPVSRIFLYLLKIKHS